MPKGKFSLVHKQQILLKIREKILQEADILTKSAKLSHQYATDTESKAEDKYDTRGLEAAYLAEGQAKLAKELHQAITIYDALALKSFSEKDPIALTAIVEVECDGEKALYFIGPKNGGIMVEYEGQKMVLITPISPLGQLLIGKKEGDYFEMKVGGMLREYEVMGVW